MKPANRMLRLAVIKTANKVYISDNIENKSYFHTELKNLIIDGSKPRGTYSSDWFEVDKIPEVIQAIKPKKQVNKRYELKSGYPESELTPKVISYSEWDDSYDDVRGLYVYRCDEEDEGFTDVEFEINVIEELDGNFEMKKLEYTPIYNFLDKIQTHPKLLPLKPCKLTHEESFKIIRNFVKNNIDPKYAVVTSDYDFCFTVKKRVELYEPRQYQVDVNLMYSRRKPKYETRYQHNREVTVFEVAPKKYQDYTVVTPFEGDSYENLLENVEAYLQELITKINEPLKECECCKGRGVIIDDNN